MTDDPALQTLARRWFARCVALEARAVAEAAYEEAADFDMAVDDACREADVARARVDADDWQSVAALADDLLREADFALEPGGDSYVELCRYLARAYAEAAWIKAERMAGARSPEPRDPLFAAPAPSTQPSGWRP